jgi:hypothetical protein
MCAILEYTPSYARTFVVPVLPMAVGSYPDGRRFLPPPPFMRLLCDIDIGGGVGGGEALVIIYLFLKRLLSEPVK